MRAIAAVSSNGIIGNKGKLPWHCPEDLMFFKEITHKGNMVMGRNTFESVGILANRNTYILSSLPKRKQKDFLSKFIPKKTSKVSFINSINQAPEDSWLCGGGQLYSSYLEFCSDLYLTVIHKEVEGDTYFPEDYKNYFKINYNIYAQSKNDFSFEIRHYTNILFKNE